MSDDGYELVIYEKGDTPVARTHCAYCKREIDYFKRIRPVYCSTKCQIADRNLIAWLIRNRNNKRKATDGPSYN